NVKRRIVVLGECIERGPEVSREKACYTTLADQGRISRVLIRELVIVGAYVKHHLWRDCVNRVSRDAHTKTVAAVDRQQQLTGWIRLEEDGLELPVAKEGVPLLCRRPVNALGE